VQRELAGFDRLRIRSIARDSLARALGDSADADGVLQVGMSVEAVDGLPVPPTPRRPQPRVPRRRARCHAEREWCAGAQVAALGSLDAVYTALRRRPVTFGAPQAGGSRVFLTPPPPPPGHLLTSFHTILIVRFGGHLPTSPSF
jgi:hypothetical protein